MFYLIDCRVRIRSGSLLILTTLNPLMMIGLEYSLQPSSSNVHRLILWNSLLLVALWLNFVYILITSISSLLLCFSFGLLIDVVCLLTQWINLLRPEWQKGEGTIHMHITNKGKTSLWFHVYKMISHQRIFTTSYAFCCSINMQTSRVQNMQRLAKIQSGSS